MLGSPSARAGGVEASEVEPADQMHLARGYTSPRVSLPEMCSGWWDPFCSVVEPSGVPFFTGDQSILFRQHGFSDGGGGTQQTRCQPSGVPSFTGDQGILFQQLDSCDGELKDAELDSCRALDKLPMPGARTGTVAKDVPLPSCRDAGCAAEFEQVFVSELEPEGLCARGCSARESAEFPSPIPFPIASDSESEGRWARGTPLLEIDRFVQIDAVEVSALPCDFSDPRAVAQESCASNDLECVVAVQHMGGDMKTLPDVHWGVYVHEVRARGFVSPRVCQQVFRYVSVIPLCLALVSLLCMLMCMGDVSRAGYELDVVEGFSGSQDVTFVLRQVVHAAGSDVQVSVETLWGEFHGRSAEPTVLKAKQKTVKQAVSKKAAARANSDGQGVWSEEDHRYDLLYVSRGADFVSSDRDGDGTISLPEFRLASRRISVSAFRPVEVEEIFHFVDKNKNGVLSVTEYLNAVAWFDD